MNKIITLCLIAIVCMTALASAHKPYIIGATKDDILVSQPEISKAYYGQLDGEDIYYVIDAKEPFTLYVNILAPDPSPTEEPQNSDLSIYITNNNDINIRVEGTDWNWTQYYEEYGRDHYLKGPEYKANVSEGIYYIGVYSPTNTEKYALAIGEKEDFNLFTYITAFFKALYLDVWFFR